MVSQVHVEKSWWGKEEKSTHSGTEQLD